jgi:hypothetical protein
VTSARLVRSLAWLGLGALVVLSARTLAYALVPGPLAESLEHQAGGPRLPEVAVVSTALALASSSAILFLATLGVRERRLLERTPLSKEPSFSSVRFAARAGILFLGTAMACALLESYLHRRAGLGSHGLECLTGQVHRNMLPIVAALSLVAAALFSALEHVVGWMRRTISRLRVDRIRVRSILAPSRRPPRPAPHSRLLAQALRARGPPVAIS